MRLLYSPEKRLKNGAPAAATFYFLKRYTAVEFEADTGVLL